MKFAKNDKGREANLREQELWERYKAHPTRAAMLCPVLWCADDGGVLLMKAAQPVRSDFTFRMIPDWDYMSGSDDPCPFEPKAQDWGLLDGMLVAVDYGISE